LTLKLFFELIYILQVSILSIFVLL